MLESLYCALIVYVPACSGLSGRLIDAVPRLLRNWNVPATEPLGRVTLNTTPPVGDAPVLLVTVAVVVGPPLVRGGCCELGSEPALFTPSAVASRERPSVGCPPSPAS